MFGIRPWEWGDMDDAEVELLIGVVDRYRAQIEAQNRG